MPNKIVNPPELGPPRGFAHAIVSEPGARTVHLAGQIGDGGSLVEQFDNALANLLTALRASGGTPEDLVALQVFTTDISTYRAELKQLGEAWRKHFGNHYPAMGLFETTGLFDRAATVEVMGTAVLQSP
jgi:enamine deaminase RidA (YjgF/YER057c/UK114 family)